MTKRMLIDALHTEETRVVIADENQIYDFDFVSTAKKQLKGNIYLAKITRVEPSLQAAFIEYGGGKQGFLPFAEIHTDYYQIPVADRLKLMEEYAKEIAKEVAGGNVAETEAVSEVAENTGTDLDYVSEAVSEEIIIEPQSVEVVEIIDENQERPAYLTHGAIDASIGENLTFGEDTEATVEASTEASAENIDKTKAEQVSENSVEVEAGNQEGAEVKETVESINEEVETVALNEDEREDRHKRSAFLRRYKIQEVIRRGQVILVQVIKEERGNKGVSLTTYLSLAGRYCVLMPNSPKDGGISRKIASVEDRKRLKAISTEFRLAEGMSVIIRTAGMDRTRAEIKRDFDYLVNLWNAIREDTLKSNAPALIYEESDIVKRAIRDQYSNDIEEVMVEGEAGFKSARDFMKLLMPSHVAKIKQYNSATPLFYAYGIEEQLLSMHDPVVNMKSGAYLVINPTEALISIDVNSGRATGERNIEETALKTNVEAATEIGRQLRLRDLAGLVVIDFIDMLDSRNRRAVEKALKDSLKHDRAKIQLGRISPFGLLEMSRQRLRPSISETSMMQCPHCIGRGIIRSSESMAIQMIRAIEKDASSGQAVGLRVSAPQALALYMLNSKRDALRELEKRYDMQIQILINPELTSAEFVVEKIRKNQANERVETSRPPRRPERPERQERPERNRSVSTNVQDAVAGAKDAELVENDGEKTSETADAAGETVRKNRRRGKRGGRGGRPDRSASNPENAVENTGENTENNSDNVLAFVPANVGAGTGAEGENAEAASGENVAKKPHRERGGQQARRKWRDRSERTGEKTGETASNDDVPTRWDGGAAALAEGATLPAFASDSRPVAVPAPPTYKPFHDHKPEVPTVVPQSQPEKPASPKRGWWQKMISLDD